MEGKQGTHWTRSSGHRFRANVVRLQFAALAYKLSTLWRSLIQLPQVKRRSLTSLRR